MRRRSRGRVQAIMLRLTPRRHRDQFRLRLGQRMRRHRKSIPPDS